MKPDQHGGGRHTYCQWPALRFCSALFQSHHRRETPMSRVIHFEIQADDPDRAERFYTEVFGWATTRIGGPMDYRLVTTGPDDQPGINGAIMKRQGKVDGQALTAYV